MTSREEFEKWAESNIDDGSPQVTAWRTWQARQPEIDELAAQVEAMKRKDEEIAKLREELAAAEDCASGFALDLMNEQENMQHWVQRAEAAEAISRQFEFLSKIRTKDTTIEQLAAEYQRGRADKRAEAEKEEPFDADNPKFMEALLDTLRGLNLPVTRKGSGFRSPYTQGCLEVSFEVVNRLNLYTRPLAQKPLTEQKILSMDIRGNQDEALRFARAIEAAHGITEKKEG